MAGCLDQPRLLHPLLPLQLSIQMGIGEVYCKAAKTRLLEVSFVDPFFPVGLAKQECTFPRMAQLP